MAKKGIRKKLGRRKAHREALKRNQLRSIFTYGYITTTTPKAKMLKSKVEEFLNGIGKETLEANRDMHAVLGKKDLVNNARKYIKEGEGKVRIVRIGFRDGDAAEISKLFLSGYENVFDEHKPKSKQSKKPTASKKQEKTESKEPERIVEKDEDKEKVDKDFMNKANTKLKGQFSKKEKARRRSGI